MWLLAIFKKYIKLIKISKKKIDVLRCSAKSFFRNKFISVLPCITLKLKSILGCHRKLSGAAAINRNLSVTPRENSPNGSLLSVGFMLRGQDFKTRLNTYFIHPKK